LAVLLLLCLILYASGLASIRPVDRDEARFAQGTRQMLETGGPNLLSGGATQQEADRNPLAASRRGGVVQHAWEHRYPSVQSLAARSSLPV
jgi:hypothetical protein